MTYLLDTNAISEPTKDRPNASALAWLEARPSNQSFLSTISIAEISYGIERLAPGRRADRLTRWRDRLIITLGPRLLPVDAEVALTQARIRRASENARRTIPILDAFLAATAEVHGLTLVTRNVRDFQAWGGPLFNPWDD